MLIKIEGNLYTRFTVNKKKKGKKKGNEKGNQINNPLKTNLKEQLSIPYKT